MFDTCINILVYKCVYTTFSRIHEMTGMTRLSILYKDIIIIVVWHTRIYTYTRDRHILEVKNNWYFLWEQILLINNKNSLFIDKITCIIHNYYKW